jgi:DNA-3-methyladenine glycosylase
MVAGPAAEVVSAPSKGDSLARVRARGVLTADFYARPVLEVARDLIGCVVEHAGMSGLIVETEAYHESEPACHAFVGVTPRTRTLYEEPGTAYVYRSYGIHSLLNAVCEPPGVAAAVLIRALEPLDGVEEMRARRARAREHELCSGPGKLTQALGVELAVNGTSLVSGPVTIHAGNQLDASLRPDAAGYVSTRGGSVGSSAILTGPRIGITKAVDLPWRFCLAGSPHVSRPWAA